MGNPIDMLGGDLGHKGQEGEINTAAPYSDMARADWIKCGDGYKVGYLISTCTSVREPALELYAINMTNHLIRLVLSVM
ncbi:hypothetical protein GCM10022394_22820 [Zobellella aerophila]|uniref:Uncharacterized protein n=1 Tax=Zobellella aerophila TaxID=870480 RepID=A0ABP6VZF6_9GAMM